MKERPILFSGAMVRAILEGKKTQTRRVVKWPEGFEPETATVERFQRYPDGSYRAIVWGSPYDDGAFSVKCKYGGPGDRLWVRETWGVHRCIEQAYQRDRCQVGVGLLHYKADEGCHPVKRWRPCIHMPRWASRIALEVTGVRVERVQEISVEDALAEGMLASDPYKLAGEYEALWNEINAKRGYGWDVNPWVWVVEFKRV